MIGLLKIFGGKNHQSKVFLITVKKNKNNLFQRSCLHLSWLPVNDGELGYGLGGFGRKNV